MNYEQKVEVVKARYEERIVALLERVRHDLDAESFEVGEQVYTLHDDELRWAITVNRPGGERTDVTFEISESLAYEGNEDGINFSVTIVRESGTVMGQNVPYNFSDEVWVSLDDAEATEARFKIVEDAVGLIDFLRERL